MNSCNTRKIEDKRHIRMLDGSLHGKVLQVDCHIQDEMTGKGEGGQREVEIERNCQKIKWSS